MPSIEQFLSYLKNVRICYCGGSKALTTLETTVMEKQKEQRKDKTH